MGEAHDDTAQFELTGLEGASLRSPQVAATLYRSLFEGSADAILTVDAQGRLIDANPAAIELLGYARQELLGLWMADLAAGGLTEDRFAHWVRVGYWPGGLAVRQGDGAVLSVAARVTPAELPGGTVYLAALRDLGAREAAEELRRRDVILEAVAFAAEQLLAPGDWGESVRQVLGRLGVATGVSRAYVFENHHGRDGELLTSQRFEWVAPGVAAQLDNPDLQDFSYQASGFERWIGELGQGELIQGHVRAFPASERRVLADQDIRSIVLVPIFVGPDWWGFIGFDDCRAEREWSIAETDALRLAARALGAAIQRERAETARAELFREQAARAEAEAVLRARDELLSSAAHELRTPLATILGHLELLGGGFGAGDPDGRALAAIERQARRLGRLVEELLEVSRLELGRLELRRRRLEMGELVTGVLAELRPASPGHRLVLERERPVWVEADGYRIEQVLLNLLGNAIKFSPEGGQITVRVLACCGEAVVSVRDRGIGIPAERQAGIFERYRRAHAGTAEDPGGMGLGLHLSRELVRAHGGRLWFESTEGQGSTFSFGLPLAEEGEGQAERACQ